MPRPRKCRQVCCLPRHDAFAPVGCGQTAQAVVITVDEYETIRLIDYEGLSQEACAASGRGFAARWTKILLPLITGPILSGAFMIFVPSLTELTLSSILASAGTKTIGLTIFNYQQGGDYNLAAAMSVIITILVVGGYCIVNRKHLFSVNKEVKGYEPAYKKGDKKLREDPSPEGNRP